VGTQGLTRWAHRFIAAPRTYPIFNSEHRSNKTWSPRAMW